MKLTIDLKALKGEEVEVLNSRKKPAIWERGVVSLIEIRVSYTNTLYATYRVVLDRKSDRMGNIVLYIGEDKIRKLQDYPGINGEPFSIKLTQQDDMVNVRGVVLNTPEKDSDGSFSYKVKQL